MDDLDYAILEFEEAVRQGRNKTKARTLVRPLEAAIRKAFRAQGSHFVKGLKKKKAGLFVANHESMIEDPWMRYSVLLNMAFKEAITPNDWIEIWILATTDTMTMFSEPLQSAIEKALQMGAMSTLSSMGLKPSFDLSNPRAVDFLRDYGADQVRKINDTTKGILNDILTQAGSEGWSYQRTEQAIVDQFNEFTFDRAHLIATTELGNAYCEGNYDAAQSLQDAGLEVEKAWLVHGEGCEKICGPNGAAGYIPLNDDFPSGDDRPLGHPGCECDLLTRVKQ